MIFKLMHHLTLGEAAVFAMVVIGCIIMWGRSRDRRAEMVKMALPDEYVATFMRFSRPFEAQRFS